MHVFVSSSNINSEFLQTTWFVHNNKCRVCSTPPGLFISIAAWIGLAYRAFRIGSLSCDGSRIGPRRALWARLCRAAGPNLRLSYNFGVLPEPRWMNRCIRAPLWLPLKSTVTRWSGSRLTRTPGVLVAAFNLPSKTPAS